MQSATVFHIDNRAVVTFYNESVLDTINKLSGPSPIHQGLGCVILVECPEKLKTSIADCIVRYAKEIEPHEPT